MQDLQYWMYCNCWCGVSVSLYKTIHGLRYSELLLIFVEKFEIQWFGSAKPPTKFLFTNNFMQDVGRVSNKIATLRSSKNVHTFTSLRILTHSHTHTLTPSNTHPLVYPPLSRCSYTTSNHSMKVSQNGSTLSLWHTNVKVTVRKVTKQKPMD